MERLARYGGSGPLDVSVPRHGDSRLASAFYSVTPAKEIMTFANDSLEANAVRCTIGETTEG